MGFRIRLAGVAAAAAIAAGAGVEIRSAQSLTIPDACVLGAGACAEICHSLDDQSRTPADFIALASYQLGPEKPIDLPPANLTMPAPVDPQNVYAGDRRRACSARRSRAQLDAGLLAQPHHRPGRRHRPRDVQGGRQLFAIPSAEHIVPSWDLQTLWVSGDVSYRGGPAHVTPIDPKTGKLGKAIPVPDSYNMYFTPDGRSAIIVAEAMRRLEFRDPHTMELQGYITTPALRRHQPRRFLARRLLRDLHLRVQR